ncbi:hypothetical protein QLQ12_26770 [Actinoplanes sp. NEAU-A12]|uniref:Calcium-binding protein n=1 Tax=Actinoplanes sandaracinus TaxID=3045177 RepID=A0ABT6WR61_9ACTN|nr:hypothetical protein [Actinoplanes sandaracinus]MDI6102226.1 hypothetical protein [Actinoplanes sandaracinus]
MRLARSRRYGAATVAALIVAVTPAPAQAGKPVSATGKACTVLGTVGNDHLLGTHGYDVICGLGGNDVIKGGGGKDVVDGGEGDDDIDGEDGADTVIGGPGNDKVHGGRGNDQVRGGDDTDDADGGAGADLVDGGAGDDTVDGGAPIDEPDPVTAGDRVIGGDGADTLHGGPGADTLKGGDGSDVVNGGDGNDIAGGDTGDDTVDGGDGSDRLDGGDGTDHLEGGAGSDGVNGGGGDDTLAGGIGDDTVRGGVGNDQATGGDGSDKLVGGPGNDGLDGGGGNDAVAGGDGTDTVTGGDGNDSLDGGGGDDTITGGPGTDELAGGEGSDTMNGGDGDDRMDGGLGDDTMNGGAGNDDVEGGPGLNACVPDPSDLGGDKCTDKATPRIDTASLAWAVGPTVSNSETAPVKVRGHITDDRSGVVLVEIWFRHPEPDGPGLWVGTWGNVVEGHTHDGTFEMTGTLPSMSRAGEWKIDHIHLRDRVNRSTRYYIAPNGDYQLQTTLNETGSGHVSLAPMTVTGTFDVDAPVVDTGAMVWQTPLEVDNAEDREVRVRVPVTDDLSGATSVSVVLAGAEENGPQVHLGGSSLVEGTPRDGVWEVTGRVPAYLPTGTWRVHHVWVRDEVNRNVNRYRPPEATDGVNWPSALTVSGALEDLQRPAVDLTQGQLLGESSGDNGVDRTVRLRIRASDDRSGIQHIWAHFVTAGGNGYPGAESNLDLVYGSEDNGWWELRGTLPATTSPGQWRVDRIGVNDKVGRSQEYAIAADGGYIADGESGTATLPTYTLTPIGG